MCARAIWRAGRGSAPLPLLLPLLGVWLVFLLTMPYPRHRRGPRHRRYAPGLALISSRSRCSAPWPSPASCSASRRSSRSTASSPRYGSLAARAFLTCDRGSRSQSGVYLRPVSSAGTAGRSSRARAGCSPGRGTCSGIRSPIRGRSAASRSSASRSWWCTACSRPSAACSAELQRQPWNEVMTGVADAPPDPRRRAHLPARARLPGAAGAHELAGRSLGAPQPRLGLQRAALARARRLSRGGRDRAGRGRLRSHDLPSHPRRRVGAPPPRARGALDGRRPARPRSCSRD